MSKMPELLKVPVPKTPEESVQVVVPELLIVPLNDLAELELMISELPAAMLTEPVPPMVPAVHWKMGRAVQLALPARLAPLRFRVPLPVKVAPVLRDWVPAVNVALELLSTSIVPV